MSCLNRMRLAQSVLLAALGVVLCLFHITRAQAKVDNCYINSSFVDKYGGGKKMHLDVTGIFEGITGAPSSDVFLGTRTYNLFDNADDLDCSTSSGGNGVTAQGSNSVPASGIAGVDPEGRTLFLVSPQMPGIAYSLDIVCQGGDTEGECKGHSGDTIPIVANAVNNWSDQDGHPWDNLETFGRKHSGLNFKLNFYFWQLTSWRPFAYDADIAGSSYKIFSIRFGGSSNRNVYYLIDIYMAPVTPTCDTHISVEGNPSAEINLGDGITPQQLSGDSTDKVPFTLVVDNCSATLNNVYVKMTSTRVDSNNATLLGQQSGSAAGVGVKITDTQDNPLLPDGTSALTFPYIGEVNHREMPMQAQLVSDGTPLQPGDFQASATFNISYD